MIDSTAREKGAARRVREMESISQVRRLEGLASSFKLRESSWVQLRERQTEKGYDYYL